MLSICQLMLSFKTNGLPAAMAEAARRRCSIYTYRQFRRSNASDGMLTRGGHRLCFPSLLSAGFPSPRNEYLSFRASFFSFLPYSYTCRLLDYLRICSFSKAIVHEAISVNEARTNIINGITSVVINEGNLFLCIFAFYMSFYSVDLR